MGDDVFGDKILSWCLSLRITILDFRLALESDPTVLAVKVPLQEATH